MTEVKTVRRKLHEIGARKLSRTLADTFARRWAQAEPEALGYLYIDGHVRPYHGRRHRLPRTFVQRRRLCMPATTEVWVNDARAQPWFFVTTEANNHLLAAIERDILAPLRKEVGAERRVTLVFDREGWSPKAFARWAAAGFDVMTYRKGRYDPWPQDAFVAVVDPTPTRGGKPVTWRLAERETDLGTGRGQPVFRMREVRRLCDNGHQTSIMTTRRDLATPPPLWIFEIPPPGNVLHSSHKTKPARGTSGPVSEPRDGAPGCQLAARVTPRHRGRFPPADRLHFDNRRTGRRERLRRSDPRRVSRNAAFHTSVRRAFRDDRTNRAGRHALRLRMSTAAYPPEHRTRLGSDRGEPGS